MYKDSKNCPQCGNALPLAFRYTKLTVCEHCDSTLFLEDHGTRLAGTRSVLAETPSLIQLKQPFQYAGKSYLPVGHIRYNYGYGYWDEWWIVDNAGDGSWMSIDEGDFAFELPQSLPDELPAFATLQLGKTVRLLDKDWQVTELARATCEGFRGELPEIVTSGDQFDYAHLSGPQATLLTLEYSDGQTYGFAGRWVDPFEIKVD